MTREEALAKIASLLDEAGKLAEEHGLVFMTAPYDYNTDPAIIQKTTYDHWDSSGICYPEELDVRTIGWDWQPSDMDC